MTKRAPTRKAKMGRPTRYTKAIADAICTRIAGGESLRSVCLDKEMPDKSTVLLWIASNRHPDFSDQYAQAREAQGYAFADEIAEIAHDTLRNKHAPQAAKVAVDALKWAAERQAAKVYGNKSESKVEMSGPGGSPMQFDGKIEIEFVGIDGDDDE